MFGENRFTWFRFIFSVGILTLVLSKNCANGADYFQCSQTQAAIENRSLVVQVESDNCFVCKRLDHTYDPQIQRQKVLVLDYYHDRQVMPLLPSCRQFPTLYIFDRGKTSRWNKPRINVDDDIDYYFRGLQ